MYKNLPKVKGERLRSQYENFAKITGGVVIARGDKVVKGIVGCIVS